MTYAIAIDSLAYRAGRHFAIRDLRMRVPNGSVYGFLGPNGSGKTTTIRLLLGMLSPTDGTISVLGHDMPRGAHHALARVGYVPERLHLYPMLTVEETMRYHASFYARWDAAEAEKLRRSFDLRAEQRISRLSKGEAGKLMMLLALAVKPELLVLDEPTDGLDPVVRRDVLSAVLEYVSTNGATVLVSSHLVHEQERVCDWIGVMDGGRLVAEMPMHAFRSGIKRLRIVGAPREAARTPFGILARRAGAGREEEWVVRDWRDDMTSWFANGAGALREVVDLDLEESFVETLRAARDAGGRAA
ncbi:MAG TPA: ABC transporter ATP-binding protein [Gemmatimonadaceae bacterium]|nr:ABC transporter ATP-binding protein [Gemmatimonadaceae bacterium]